MRTLFGLALAATILAVAPQNASAWSNVKFGVGLNFEKSAAGNSFCKIWHNGQIPPPMGGGYYGGGPGMPFPGGAPMMPFGQPIDFQGAAPVAAPAPLPPHASYTPAPAANPFHYSSYSNSYNYYPQPYDYYGQSYGYGQGYGYGW